MPIPYGLLGQTDIEKKKRGPFKPGEGYWLGNQYMFPNATPPMPGGMSPPPAQQQMFTPEPTPHPQGGILGPVWSGGDGGAGNGVGGGPGPSAPGPSFSEPGHVNAPDLAAAVGLPSLPSFQEPAPTAPAPGLDPAPGLSTPEEAAAGVPGSEANAPSGGKAGKSGMSATQAASQAATQAATANTAAAIAAVDQAVQQNPASFMDAVRSAMQATAPGIGTMSSGAEAAAAAAAEAAGPAGVAGSEQNSPNAVGGMMGGDSGMGGVGPGGDPNGGAGSPGAEASSPDNLRHGGFVGDDGDDKLEVRKINAHEREFVLRPEAAQYYGKGILGALNAKAIPKAKLSGLLRL